MRRGWCRGRWINGRILIDREGMGCWLRRWYSISCSMCCCLSGLGRIQLGTCAQDLNRVNTRIDALEDMIMIQKDCC